MAKKAKTPETNVTAQAADELRYMPGSPKQYRADAKVGQFNINGRTVVGDSLEIHPIAYRFFRDNLFNRGALEWVELFFINEKNCLSSIMFNGYSVQNLVQLLGELFYDDVTLTDIVLGISWEKHKNEEANAVYFIAQFNVVEEVSDEVKQAVTALTNEVAIYRADTVTPTCEIREQVNYSIPAHLLPEELMDNVSEGNPEEETANSETPAAA